jgi:PAP2 superfamily
MTKFTTSRLLLSVLVLTALFFNACKTDTPNPPKTVDTYEAKAVIQWNTKFLEVERFAAGCRPTPAPRMLAYIGLAVYESCANGLKTHNSIASNFSGLTIPAASPGYEYHYPTVVNAAYAYMAKQFFGAIPSITTAQLDGIEALRKTLEADFASQTDPATFTKSKEYGEAVAKAVYEYAATDAIAHNHHLDPFKDNVGKYVGSAAPGSWSPTVPGPKKPMFPDAGYWRTFSLKNDSEKLIKKPIPYSTNKNSQYYQQGLEVVNTVLDITPDQRWLAFFWSDDLTNVTFSPGPRWMAIGTQALIQSKSNLETAIFMDAKIGLALNDAAVACWYNKYYYNVERPETYIKNTIDPSWEPILYNKLTGDTGFTPPFPAYPSGHSTMAAAGAEALSSIFGYNYSLTDRCHEGRSDFEGSTPRSFNSFYEMAEEDAYSRIPLGVHWRMDCEEGVNLGYRVGRKVSALNWEK